MKMRNDPDPRTYSRIGVLLQVILESAVINNKTDKYYIRLEKRRPEVQKKTR